MPTGPATTERALVVIGAGAAGLYTALRAAREGARVTLVSATELAQTSSYWAQGGCAAVLADTDSIDLHLADTLTAGRGAVRLSAARVLVQEAPAAVEDLMRLGMVFDTDADGRLVLGLEGGHSHRRIVHAGGAETGRRIVHRLTDLVAAEELIEVVEGHPATRLLVHDGRVTGVELADGRRLLAPATVLCTGGAAALWARTTNPSGAAGSGLLLAYAAGAALADVEFMQFHPTAVVTDPSAGGDGLLVTEAIRGEGAKLVNEAGERFVQELAPRDEVARAIFTELLRSGSSAVGLDMRAVDPRLFPTVVEALRAVGIDPARELVPVAPAAHYMMGGIETDLDARSTVPGLLAVGECSCTGLHGANRLASNSLSECFVFGARAAAAALEEPALTQRQITDSAPAPMPAAPHAGPPRAPGEAAPAGTPSQRSGERLWRYAGVERDRDGLTQLLEDPHPLVRLIATAALARTESRGAHWRRDYPRLDEDLDGQHVTLVTDEQSTFSVWR